ncbi:MAG: VOC family protein [Actinomycetota bacterium]|nr:VOC family protein [Actinomycetota bacterium]
MAKIHHAAICVRDVDASVRFWRDGLGFAEIMDASFDGDWPTLFSADSSHLRSVFLGDPDDDGGIVELVSFGNEPPIAPSSQIPVEGFFLLSVNCDVEVTLARLAELGLGGDPRRISAYGVTMVVVREPSGVRVELIDLPSGRTGPPADAT